MDPINYLRSITYICVIWVHCLKFQIHENMQPSIDLLTSRVLEESIRVYMIECGYIWYLHLERRRFRFWRGLNFHANCGYNEPILNFGIGIRSSLQNSNFVTSNTFIVTTSLFVSLDLLPVFNQQSQVIRLPSDFIKWSNI